MKHWIALVVAMTILGGCVSRTYVDVPIEVCDHIKDRADRTKCEDRVNTAAMATPESGKSPPGVNWMAQPFYWLWIATYYGIGLIIARWIYVDARTRSWLAFRIRPIWWAILCVVDPAIGILVYWLTHYSRLVPRLPRSESPPESTPEG